MTVVRSVVSKKLDLSLVLSFFKSWSLVFLKCELDCESENFRYFTSVKYFDEMIKGIHILDLYI